MRFRQKYFVLNYKPFANGKINMLSFHICKDKDYFLAMYRSMDFKLSRFKQNLCIPRNKIIFFTQ